MIDTNPVSQIRRASAMLSRSSRKRWCSSSVSSCRPATEGKDRIQLISLQSSHGNWSTSSSYTHQPWQLSVWQWKLFFRRASAMLSRSSRKRWCSSSVSSCRPATEGKDLYWLSVKGQQTSGSWQFNMVPLRHSLGAEWLSGRIKPTFQPLLLSLALLQVHGLGQGKRLRGQDEEEGLIAALPGCRGPGVHPERHRDSQLSQHLRNPRQDKMLACTEMITVCLQSAKRKHLLAQQQQQQQQHHPPLQSPGQGLPIFHDIFRRADKNGAY
ncbi:hypothetical protein CRUP_003345 [Coryphaenoides rupestris]|nr:hypothetical protein CRUP_003345 [Coryphaenoides rupestris]